MPVRIRIIWARLEGLASCVQQPCPPLWYPSSTSRQSAAFSLRRINIQRQRARQIAARAGANCSYPISANWNLAIGQLLCAMKYVPPLLISDMLSSKRYLLCRPSDLQYSEGLMRPFNEAHISQSERAKSNRLGSFCRAALEGVSAARRLRSSGQCGVARAHRTNWEQLPRRQNGWECRTCAPVS